MPVVASRKHVPAALFSAAPRHAALGRSALAMVIFLAAPALRAADDSASTPVDTAAKLSIDDCVDIALSQSAKIQEAEANVQIYQARLAEVESSYRPKLMGMAFIAPMFSTDFGDIASTETTRRYKRAEDWGPYTRLEAVLAQPLYTFGRVEAGREAAAERALVEVSRVRQAELAVALEVHRYAYLYLYLRSILPTLNTGIKAVSAASEKAGEMYDAGDGEVTQADLMKLAYASTELAKLDLKAKGAMPLVLAALKHTMGWAADEPLALSLAKLPPLTDADKEADDSPAAQASALATLIAESAQNRPEWAQLAHGKKAALAWRDAEALANMPVLFLAGQIEAAWTPTREDTRNPYHVDDYNDVFGGIALGLQFNIDPWMASAKAEGATATHAQIEALGHFAETGIPLQVQQAHHSVQETIALTRLSRAGVKATRKWMTFSATAFATGTGEASDLLEGLGAYLQAKNGYYESMRDYHLARAQLDMAVGRGGRGD